MAPDERLEYLLPCGHRSAGLACFQCAFEEFAAGERAAAAQMPGRPVPVPRELTITVSHPPHVRRFVARGSKR